MLQKLQAKEEDLVWFYCQGWRVGEIIKQYTKQKITVKDCTGRRYRVQMNSEGKWVARSNTEFKGENHIKKGKTDGKKRIKIKGSGKRRLKIKIKRRKIRKSRKRTQTT